jgi:hypothetical protein
MGAPLISQLQEAAPAVPLESIRSSNVPDHGSGIPVA